MRSRSKVLSRDLVGSEFCVAGWTARAALWAWPTGAGAEAGVRVGGLGSTGGGAGQEGGAGKGNRFQMVLKAGRTDVPEVNVECEGVRTRMSPGSSLSIGKNRLAVF